MSFDQLQSPRSVVDPAGYNATVIGPNNELDFLTHGNHNLVTPSSYSTTSLTGVMLGAGVYMTGLKSGIFRVIATLMPSNNTAGDGFAAQIRVGTGVAPAQGAALAGSPGGEQLSGTSPAANQPLPLTLIDIFSNNVGTVLWVDLGVNALTGGTATFANVQILVEEL